MLTINNFTYVEDLFCVNITQNGGFKFKLSNSIIILNLKLKFNVLFNSFSNIRSSLKHNLFTSKKIFQNMNFNSEFGKVSYLYLKGIGFKVLNYLNVLFFKLNYSHYIYYALPLEIKVLTRKKNKLMKFQFFNEVHSKNIINKLSKFRVANIYTQKGMFKKSQIILKKEGKKKQI
uniref:Ribosomal protein L6 n=1 Tax=Pharyngomonas kirbyi TaxID=63601 RepID=A0A1W6R266_9EUKA|nr:ribosomal protein L6 [Pharyngomonas kirbyi]ARO47985.1 ribosomal protein L6 [Pharyngomonas kirbyi]